METQEKISSLLREHALWQTRINGFREELKKLNGDLGAFLLKMQPRDVPPEAEHFQNQFILQKEVLDILRHDMKQYENMLEANLGTAGKNTEEHIMMERSALENRLNDFDRLFAELRTEYFGFISMEPAAL